MIEMSNKVGQKGQVVISKKIRDQLGVEPGSLTVQTVVDGHLEILFFPPEHNRSLLGVLAPYTNVVIPADADWSKIKEEAWEAAVREKYEILDEQS
jgi:AbrB family looped-hinge helix DNA binding protein